MAKLLDCGETTSFEVDDVTLLATVSITGTSVTRDGIEWPVIEGFWSEGASWMANKYLTGVQFEYEPVDGEAGPTQTAPQDKRQLRWSVDVPGGDYWVRYRAVGVKGFGEWTTRDFISVPYVQGLPEDRIRPTASGIAFKPNDPATNQISWTSGVMLVRDGDTTASYSISSGSTSWSSGTVYVYWQEGATSLSVTTNFNTASGIDRTIMATYNGGVNLVPYYGRTIVTPEGISTPSLSAIVANLGTVTAGKAQSADGHTFFDLTNSRQQFRVGSFALRIGAIGSGVLLWFGPTSIAIGDETRTNGKFCLGDDGVIYMDAGTVLPPGGGGGGDDPEPGTPPAWEGPVTGTLAGGSWTTFWGFTLHNVPSGSSVFFSLDWAGMTTTSSGGTIYGEMRLIEASSGAVIDAGQLVEITNGGDDLGAGLSGPAVALGSVAYAIQFRQTGGSGYANLRGYGYGSAA